MTLGPGTVPAALARGTVAGPVRRREGQRPAVPAADAAASAASGRQAGMRSKPRRGPERRGGAAGKGRTRATGGPQALGRDGAVAPARRAGDIGSLDTVPYCRCDSGVFP